MMYKDKEVSLITKQIFLLYKTEYKMEKIDNTYWVLSNKQIDFIQEQGISMNDLDVLIEEINILLAKKGLIEIITSQKLVVCVNRFWTD